MQSISQLRQRVLACKWRRALLSGGSYDHTDYDSKFVYLQVHLQTWIKVFMKQFHIKKIMII
jgi:hypothetical protein